MNDERQIDYDTVGTDEAYVSVAPAEMSVALDDALDLQPISIRLQRDLLENLKALAKLNGLGYQPLIRQVLTRWVDCELKHMLREKAAAAQPVAQAEVEPEEPHIELRKAA